jgi:hypothetical protein
MPADPGRKVVLPHVVVVGFDNGKIAYEHIYWDQASLLVQIGLLDTSDRRRTSRPSTRSNSAVEHADRSADTIAALTTQLETDLFSPLRVCRENVILCLDDRVAGEAALGAGLEGLEGVGRGVVVELWVSPIAAVREPLAVPHHEIEVMQGVRY